MSARLSELFVTVDIALDPTNIEILKGLDNA